MDADATEELPAPSRQRNRFSSTRREKRKSGFVAGSVRATPPSSGMSLFGRYFMILASACAMAGCNILDISCTDEQRFGIVVTVLDDLSGDTIRGVMIRAIATEGAYADTAMQVQPEMGYHAYPLAAERTGTYRVQVDAPGYMAWTRDAVRVREDGCHVETVELTARLQRAQ